MEENKKSNYPSHKKWIESLVLYFSTIKEYEEKIESLRISLNQQNNFSSKALFNYLDNNSKNFISLDDFIKFLEDNSINYDEKYLRQFIHNYDKDNDFCINYQEFKGIILPLTDDSFKEKVENEDKKEENEDKNKDKEDKKEDKKEENEDKKEDEEDKKEDEKEDEEDKKEDNKKKDEENEENKDEKKEDKKEENKDENNDENKKEKIDPNILAIFGQILSEEMALAEKNIENAKKCLESKFFTFYESFIEIADEEKYITPENLYNFLTKNEVELNEKDMKGLIHRNDTDNDGKISFPEYRAIFYPKGDSKYKRNLNDFNKYQDEYNSILRSGKNKNNNYNYTFNSSNYYPSRNNNFKNSTNYTNNYTNNYTIKNKPYYLSNNYKNDDIYQSPKLKHTSSPLHYDYSTYADEDHDSYSRNRRFRNSSVINLKNYPNTIYDNRETDNLSFKCFEYPVDNCIIHYNNCCCCICCSDLC